MTREERRERGTRLCGRLEDDLRGAVPAEVARWGPVLPILDGATVRFTLALATWEATGNDGDITHVRTAYDGVLDAWKEAARLYAEEKETAT